MRDNIKVKPFVLLDLIEYIGFKKENEHGYVRFRAHIAEEYSSSYVEMALQECWAEVSAEDSSGSERVLFNGIVTELSIETKNCVNLLTVVLRSGSYLMDTMPHIRSYQAPSLLYKDVLSSYTDTYTDGNFIMTKGNGENIPPLILQYQETDWQFTKRLASHFNTIVMPDCKTKGNKYFFGLPQLPDSAQVVTKHFSMQKRVDEFTYKQKNGVKGLRESDAIYYILKSREIFELGSQVALNGRSLYVSEIETRLEGSELYHTYYLKSENGFMVPKTFNEKLIGASLSSQILNVEKDVVQISVDQDENKANAGVNWYSYSTPYSTPDGTGWYCMPEPGDAVRFYIPNADEAEAYVISSTHLQSSDTQERINPDYKSIMNKYHKEILFKPDSLTFTNNAGMSIEILDDIGIRIMSDKAIIIKSDSSVDISSATSTLKVTAPQSILLQQKDTNIRLKENITFRGAQIHMD